MGEFEMIKELSRHNAAKHFGANFQQVFMTNAIASSMLTAIIVFAGDAFAQSKPHLQYGHAIGWKADIELANVPQLIKQWQTECGSGRAQVVGDGEFLFVASGSSSKNKETKVVDVVTSVTAYDVQSGKQKWVAKFASQMHEKQETFGSAAASPQATPAMIGSRLIVVTFTGELICLNRDNGKVMWKKGLVSEFDAEPVQFGFSSSPVICGENREQVVVLAAGKHSGSCEFDWWDDLAGRIELLDDLFHQ
jgi:hypothetical protein